MRHGECTKYKVAARRLAVSSRGPELGMAFAESQGISCKFRVKACMLLYALVSRLQGLRFGLYFASFCPLASRQLTLSVHVQLAPFKVSAHVNNVASNVKGHCELQSYTFHGHARASGSREVVDGKPFNQVLVTK